MDCTLAILLPDFSYGHDPSYLYITILCSSWVTIIILYSTKGLENPSFLKKKLLDIGFQKRYYGIAALPKGARNDDVSQ